MSCSAQCSDCQRTQRWRFPCQNASGNWRWACRACCSGSLSKVVIICTVASRMDADQGSQMSTAAVNLQTASLVHPAARMLILNRCCLQHPKGSCEEIASILLTTVGLKVPVSLLATADEAHGTGPFIISFAD